MAARLAKEGDNDDGILLLENALVGFLRLMNMLRGSRSSDVSGCQEYQIHLNSWMIGQFSGLYCLSYLCLQKMNKHEICEAIFKQTMTNS